ncbi:MAG: hypothetical protein WHV67_04105 [Thermoanaerobaculia bacterium]
MFKKILLLLFLIFFSVSCAFYTAAVKPNVSSKNEIVATEDLKLLLLENPNPKVVIRVQNPPSNVTEAEKFNVYINTIEKVLIQSGFVVRDRALLESILKTGTTDYRAIGEKIDTDIIIDIISLAFGLPNPVRNYINKTKGIEEQFKKQENYIDCQIAKLEVRITIVNKGQLGGIFTFYVSRCDEEELDFILNPSKTKMFWKSNPDGELYEYLVAPIWEGQREYYTQVLTYQLVNQLRSYSKKN